VKANALTVSARRLELTTRRRFGEPSGRLPESGPTLACHRRNHLGGALLAQLASLDAANAMSWTARSLDKTSVFRTRSYCVGNSPLRS
jgi:hypothetical protein